MDNLHEVYDDNLDLEDEDYNIPLDDDLEDYFYHYDNDDLEDYDPHCNYRE